MVRPNTYRHKPRDVNKLHNQPRRGDRQNFERAKEKRKKKVVDDNEGCDMRCAPLGRGLVAWVDLKRMYTG